MSFRMLMFGTAKRGKVEKKEVFAVSTRNSLCLYENIAGLNVIRNRQGMDSALARHTIEKVVEGPEGEAPARFVMEVSEKGKRSIFASMILPKVVEGGVAAPLDDEGTRYDVTACMEGSFEGNLVVEAMERSPGHFTLKMEITEGARELEGALPMAKAIQRTMCEIPEFPMKLEMKSAAK
jgi:hypothetical protein